MPRKHQLTIELLPQIKEMQKQGMTQREVRDALGLTRYRQVCYLLMRGRKNGARSFQITRSQACKT